MTEISMSALARLKVIDLLALQQGRGEEVFIYADMAKKCFLSDQEKNEIELKTLPDGRSIFNPEKATATVATIGWESEEKRRLKKILDEFDRFTHVDIVWWKPLMDQL